MTDAHDPGGKTKYPLPPGVSGGGYFHGPGDRFRTILSRRWQEGNRFALWIGMNPSVASPAIDDPTCRREWTRSRDDLGVDYYIKVNVMDVRCTDSKLLRKMTPAERCSSHNEEMIRDMIGRAAIVIAAWGALHVSLRHHADLIGAIALSQSVPLWCLGRTKHGAPRHPLYVSRAKSLERYL